MTKTVYPTYSSTTSITLIEKLDEYLLSITENLDDANDSDSDIQMRTFDDVLISDGDPINGYDVMTENNFALNKNRCPILNPQLNVGNVINVQDLSFVKQFDLPTPAIAALFGAYGRGLLMASQNYIAEKLKTQFIRLSQGDECVIEVATKLQTAIQTAAQVQYLMAQPVITPLGPGTIIPV